MQIFHLFPHGHFWKLTCGAERCPVQTFLMKEQAIEACAEFIGERAGSLKIFGVGGVFEEEHTFFPSATQIVHLTLGEAVPVAVRAERLVVTLESMDPRANQCTVSILPSQT